MLLRRQHENGLLFRRVLHRNAGTRRNHKVIRQPNSELRTDLGSRAAELVVELSVDIFDEGVRVNEAKMFSTNPFMVGINTSPYWSDQLFI